jgi:hypothetical protein
LLRISKFWISEQKLAERLYENNPIIPCTTPKELELLQGMGNCYATCGADFEDTVSMVGNARGLEPREVKQILRHIKEAHGNENEYIRLRSRLPKEFSM